VSITDESSTPRSHRHQQARARRRRLLAIATLGGIVAVSALAIATWTMHRPSSAANVATELSETPARFDDDVQSIATDAESPAVYRYSVIPGGVDTPRDLTDAINQDPVVADHYRTVSLDRVRVETLKEDRRAYVSYRIGDQVYWTKHQVTLKAGERILTDGTTQIRGRCGNCIAYEPQMPTSDREPDTIEFDALAPGEPALLASRTTTPQSVPSASAVQDLTNAEMRRFQQALLGPGGGVGVGGGGGIGGVGVPSMSQPLGSLPAGGFLVDGIPGQTVVPPVTDGTPGDGDSLDGTNAPPIISLPPFTSPPPVNPYTPGPGGPGGGIPPGPGGPYDGMPPGPGGPYDGMPPGSGGPYDGSGESPLTPVENPAPIPEPGTMILLGSGLAGAYWQRRRARRR
jgi:hypothetical protein